jgi:hypothetical protein
MMIATKAMVVVELAALKVASTGVELFMLSSSGQPRCGATVAWGLGYGIEAR